MGVTVGFMPRSLGGPAERRSVNLPDVHQVEAEDLLDVSIGCDAERSEVYRIAEMILDWNHRMWGGWQGPEDTAVELLKHGEEGIAMLKTLLYQNRQSSNQDCQRIHAACLAALEKCAAESSDDVMANLARGALLGIKRSIDSTAQEAPKVLAANRGK